MQCDRRHTWLTLAGISREGGHPQMSASRAPGRSLVEGCVAASSKAARKAARRMARRARRVARAAEAESSPADYAAGSF